MRIGVIGYGLRRSLVQYAHRPEEDCLVVALADPSPRAQGRFREAYPNATLHNDYRKLIDLNVDAAILMSPDFLHEEMAVELLRAGIAVYLEKPMAITVEGCDRILRAAKESGSKLYLGHNMRHFPVVRLMRDWIQKGYIGQVQSAWCRQFVSYGGDAYFKDWHADRTKTTGLFLQKGAHDIDVLHWLCGGYAKRVSAMGKLMVYGDIADRQALDYDGEVKLEKSWPPRSLKQLNPIVDIEDLNMALMELDNGVLASYCQCHFAPDAWRNYTIIGDEGRIENFGDGPGATVKVWNKARFGFDSEGDLSETLPELAGSHGGSDPAIMTEFLRYVREGGETDTSPIAARMAVAAGCAATESVRNGNQPMDVVPLPADLAFV